ncbi:MAG: toxic anion resistance protein, partial [Bacillota bacterium]|nr:toxic anion resistance protein [Bacillota bacterium]
TLTHTNQMLIDTLDEVAKIQSEGMAKREQARQELSRVEQELSKKLREIRN